MIRGNIAIPSQNSLKRMLRQVGRRSRRSGCCALLLQAFYTIRSERQLMEQLDYNLLFRWFVGRSVDEPVWDATVFCKNRDRLLDGDIAAEFMAAVLNLPDVKQLLSSDHFSVDGTLIQAWASAH
jgi:transposase